MGPRSARDHFLHDLWLKDSVGDRWTHYWKFADEYERIDYIFVNLRLIPKIDHPKSIVYRSPSWNDASDHPPGGGDDQGGLIFKSARMRPGQKNLRKCRHLRRFAECFVWNPDYAPTSARASAASGGRPR